jgi:hypothetical protein
MLGSELVRGGGCLLAAVAEDDAAEVAPCVPGDVRRRPGLQPPLDGGDRRVADLAGGGDEYRR